MTGTAVAVLRPRLPMPAYAGTDETTWRVLANTIFPNARSADSIVMAMSYCKVRNLDILKKPVNIVSMWDSRANDGRGGYVEQIWPSINETQATAARTGQWAGMDSPKWGPDVTYTFRGQRKDKQKGWIDVEVTLTYPEWCEVTVYRTVEGQPRGFTDGPVYWREAYGKIGGTELPNDMWAKRPHGQLQKNAKAASLRAAFPEEGDGYDESEIEGTTITAPVESPERPKPQDNWQPPQGSQGSDQSSDRRDDQRGGAEDEPPAHTAAPEGAQGQRDNGGETVDNDTGEVVGPQVVSKGEGEDWIAWAQRFLVHVNKTRDEDAIKALGKLNESTLKAMEKPIAEGGAPKVYERLQAAIGKHRLTLAAPPPPKAEGEVTIIGAG